MVSTKALTETTLEPSSLMVLVFICLHLHIVTVWNEVKSWVIISGWSILGHLFNNADHCLNRILRPWHRKVTFLNFEDLECFLNVITWDGSLVWLIVSSSQVALLQGRRLDQLVYRARKVTVASKEALDTIYKGIRKGNNAYSRGFDDRKKPDGSTGLQMVG